METDKYLNKKTKNVSQISSNTENTMVLKNKLINSSNYSNGNQNQNLSEGNIDKNSLDLIESNQLNFKFDVLISLDDHEDCKKFECNLIINKEFITISIEKEMLIEISYRDIISFGVNKTKKYLNLLCTKKLEKLGKYDNNSLGNSIKENNQKENYNNISNNQDKNLSEDEDEDEYNNEENSKVTMIFIYNSNKDGNSHYDVCNEVYSKIYEFNNLVLDENVDKNNLNSLFGLVSFDENEEDENDDILYTEDNLKDD